MTSAVAAFAIAVVGTSLICCLLMTRLPNRRANQGSSGNGFGVDGGDFGGSGGRSLSHWFGGDHSALDVSAVRSTSAPAIVEAAVMAVAIDAAGLSEKQWPF